MLCSLGLQRKGIRVRDPGTVNHHVTGALGPTEIPGFTTALLHAKWLQLCLTRSNCIDCSPPGSSVHGIFQARILEWVAISYFKGYSRPRDQTHISWIGRQIFLPLSHQGNPSHTYILRVRDRKKINNSNNTLNIKVERVEVWKL